MRRQQLQQRNRRSLSWCLLGFLLVQLALAVGVETCWPAIRDPDFDDLLRVIKARRAEAPDRPLVLVLGSSRTQMGLDAGRLVSPGEPTGPLVINCGIPGGGPMMHQIVLRRLLRTGIRPDLVFMEAMPLHLSARNGPPIEERQKLSPRFSLPEIMHLRQYYAEPYRLVYPWLVGRLLPCYRHQAEFCFALGLDRSPGQTLYQDFRDKYGWVPCDKSFTPAQIEAQIDQSLRQYAGALAQPAIAPGALNALRDDVRYCQHRNIPVVLFAPPEGTAFRTFAPAVAESQMNTVRDLARQLGVPLIDARDWVVDGGFWDGHHTNRTGAEQFTERFGREVLDPYCGKERIAGLAARRAVPGLDQAR